MDTTAAKILLVVVLFLLSACGESDNTVSTIVSEEEGSGEIYYADHVGNGETLKYTHDLGNLPQDVYFIFTNPTSSDIATKTTVSASQQTRDQPAETALKSNDTSHSTLTPGMPAVPNIQGLKDRPQISGFDATPVTLEEKELQRLSSISPIGPEYSVTGSSHQFLDWDFDANQAITVTATLRQVIDTSSDITLNLWVADDSWSPCNRSKCITAGILAELGEKFLKAGDNNDIYDWMTGLFGEPWGAHSNPAYIGENSRSTVDILFYDIDSDNSTNGGVLGFFWSKDNAIRNEADKTNYTSISNQRLMFYIDSVLAATEEDSTWNITDKWPSEIVATLAHEFQHMIHFYQKTLLRAGTDTQTWLNEMCSMVAEDLVADKIHVNGPRGVAYDTYSAGPDDNSDGRMPWFNSANYLGLIDWYSGNGVYYSYAASYAFGAYLARNYNGAPLFREIVHNPYTDSEAVTSALSNLGVELTFSRLLRQWGVAVLLSDMANAAEPYQYNSGGAFSSEIASLAYNLGSINLYNYSPEPSLPESGNFTLSKQYKTANRYHKVGSGLTGKQSWFIAMPNNTRLTVVSRDSE